MLVFFFQAEDGIRDLVRSRGLGDVYKRQSLRQQLRIRPRLMIPCNGCMVSLAAVKHRVDGRINDLAHLDPRAPHLCIEASLVGGWFDEAHVLVHVDDGEDGANVVALVGTRAMVGPACVETDLTKLCLLYTSPSPRDRTRSRMPSSA